MAETQKDPTASDLGITHEDINMTTEEYKLYAEQANRIADEAKIEGEPGTAKVFKGLNKLLQGKKTKKRNAGLDN